MCVFNLNMFTHFKRVFWPAQGDRSALFEDACRDTAAPQGFLADQSLRPDDGRVHFGFSVKSLYVVTYVLICSSVLLFVVSPSVFPC